MDTLKVSDQEFTIAGWLENDGYRMDALKQAAALELNDWCLAAGFVRNLVWDHVHGYEKSTPLNDIDLIYFNPDEVGRQIDEDIEAHLNEVSSFPWSVKNQARMHIRNNDAPYTSTVNAMSFWVEIETAVGARIGANNNIELLAPFGVRSLFTNSITMNPARLKPSDFKARVESKQWLSIWPKLRLVDSGTHHS